MPSPDPYADFREESSPAEEKLKVLQALVEKSLEAALEVEKTEEAFKKAKAHAMDIDERQIPGLMDELELASFKLKSGQTVTVKETIRASIKANNKPAAYAWLNDNGHGGMIKRNVEVAFTVGQENIATNLVGYLTERYENVKQNQKVEPQTLAAFIKEQLGEGVDIPMELFGAFRQRKAKIK